MAELNLNKNAKTYYIWGDFEKFENWIDNIKAISEGRLMLTLASPKALLDIRVLSRKIGWGEPQKNNKTYGVIQDYISRMYN